MAGFACGDAFIKLTSQSLPTGQIILTIGALGTLLFALMARSQGATVFSTGFLAPPVMIRNLSEAFGSLLFISAVASTELVTVTAIFQAGPLLVTLGAALFLGEAVGRRRWSAVVLGLIGVLIILRPTTGGVSHGALLAIFAVIVLSIRDLATRRSPQNLHTLQLATWGFGMLVPTGGVLLLFQGGPMPLTLVTSTFLLGALVATMIAYFAITAALRTGEVSVVAPFRYSRLVFALVIGMTVFSERPDIWTLIGAVIVIGSGLYVFARERRKPLSNPAVAR